MGCLSVLFIFETSQLIFMQIDFMSVKVAANFLTSLAIITFSEGLHSLVGWLVDLVRSSIQNYLC